MLSSSRPRAQSEPSSPVLDSPQSPDTHQLPFTPSLDLDLDNGPSPIDHPVFAASLTPRQRARLEHASLASQQRASAREHAEEKKSSRHAEIKVAMAAFELLESRKRDMKRGGGSHARQSSGPFGGLEDVVKSVESKGVMGVFEEFEEQVRGRRAGSQAGSMHSRASLGCDEPNHQSQHGDVHHDGPHELDGKKVLAGAGGAAAVLGLVGAGYELYEHEKHLKEARKARQRTSSIASVASAPVSNRSASVASSRTASRTSSRASSPAPLARPTPSTPAAVPLSVPILRSPLVSTSASTQTPYFSTLTREQHHLVQHAAAALLLKDMKRGTLHEKFEHAIGGIEHLVEKLEEGMRTVHLTGHRGKPKKLFGTPLVQLTKHEGIDSFHGANPSGTVRIPEFLDHCITALMQMDASTEGILRKSGNLRILREVMHALDHSGGNDSVIDLAALDPVTLADLMKKFLSALPHPVLTGHLFSLFIACSHIKNVNLRRRAMHLNRDVFEVIGVFLLWLSQFAHIDVKVGNQMDLSNIAIVMAPVLLHPCHRAPHPHEVPSMISALLSLLEDQSILHSVPYELAQVLHLEVPKEIRKGDSAGLVQHLARLL
ncbi:hypothetical protein Rhopal_000702-T1 [Rhodotorula paludigena]|uniref:Rho-GAP domain-containing protein n=1 Tax=Rhodotorula paludigena TaxID=86838 RepID=A0AAV5GEI0_9BASI|nr:hypothetical protein Rhopal_000702-T1 [Rhodotorula paludigena]